MKRDLFRAASLAAGFLLWAYCPATARAADFTKYVALGDSYGAGFGAGCLVDREQRFSYPNILAQQFAIADFQQPLVSDPGLPICTGLLSLSPLEFGPVGTTPGVPENLTLPRPYDNLSVPGYKAGDVAGVVTDNGGIADLVLRGLGSARDQALLLQPTFITLGTIGNDILPAGGAALFLDGVTVTPLDLFTANYNALAASLAGSGRTGVFIGTPDARLIPLASTVPPVLTDANGVPVLDPNGNFIPLLGPGDTMFPCTPVAPDQGCPLPSGTLVTLGAVAPQTTLGGLSLLQAGIGIPVALGGTGLPLPVGSFDASTFTVNVGVVIYPDVVQQIDQRILAMNAVVQTAAAANGFAYFDFYALSQDLIANGRTIAGIHISKDFVTGGMFAFGDAVHMSNIGYSILADEIVQFINSTYGASVPRVDLSVVLFTPDVVGGAAASIAGIRPALSSLFTQQTWENFFKKFPLQNPRLHIAFPAAASVGPVPRAPVVRVGGSHGRGPRLDD